MTERYWELRSDLAYYKRVRWYLDHMPGASIVDIGPADTPVVTWGQFARRSSVDPRFDGLPGVMHYKASWLDVDLKADVITCLQVLEHVHDRERFTEKILDSCRAAIISLPYHWGGHDEHTGLDLDCLTPRPLLSEIVQELSGERRQIGLYVGRRSHA